MNGNRKKKQEKAPRPTRPTLPNERLQHPTKTQKKNSTQQVSTSEVEMILECHVCCGIYVLYFWYSIYVVCA